MSALSAKHSCPAVCCVVTSMAAFGLLVSSANAETKLRWKFQPGEKVNYEMTMDMIQAMQVGDMPITTKMNQRMDMTWRAKEMAEDGSAVMEQTIDRVRVAIVPPGPDPKPLMYDSQSKEQAPGTEIFASMFGAMIGQPITITLTPLGEVKEIKLAPQLLEAMKKASPAMSSMFSEDSMKQMISRAMFRFPEEVKPGQTWDSSLEMANPILGKQIVTTEYQYVGPEDLEGRKVEKIDMDVQQKIDATGAQAQVTIKDQSGKGVIYFDNTRGRPLETRAKSAMTMEISVGGKKIESNVTTNVTMKEKAPDAKE